jgi:putative transposase
MVHCHEPFLQFKFFWHNGNSQTSRIKIKAALRGAAKKNSNTAKFQLWQPESHPIQLINNKMAHQKLDYIHYNPVEAGFVMKAEEWKYSSAIDYYGGKGLLEIIKLDILIV